MREISLSEQKEIQIGILKYVDRLCYDNNIEYSLCGGTLLGAVRHKGFIPWDDDIDIFLTRPEYERLMLILKAESSFLLISPENKDYFSVFSKLIDKRTVIRMDNPCEPTIPNLGVFIDIFPIDGLPDDPDEQMQFVKVTRQILSKMLMAMPRTYYISDFWWKRLIKKIIYFPEHILLNLISSPGKWKAKLLDAMQTYDFNTSSYAGFILSAYASKEILPKDAFVGRIELDFEGYKFPAFKNYELYLKAIYGDYMQLPPLDKRKSHHRYTAFWK